MTALKRFFCKSRLAYISRRMFLFVRQVAIMFVLFRLIRKHRIYIMSLNFISERQVRLLISHTITFEFYEQVPTTRILLSSDKQITEIYGNVENSLVSTFKNYCLIWPYSLFSITKLQPACIIMLLLKSHSRLFRL
jgi:hypothetical protein